MRNKELFLSKVGRIDGKLKAIRVLSTRPHSPQDIHKLIDEIDEQMEDLGNMVERE